MRVPTVADHWKHVYENKYSFRIDNLNFRNLRGLNSGTITFSGGVTAICGPNGVGKTTLLNAIYSVLNALPTNNGEINHMKLGEAELLGELKTGADELTRTLKINRDGFDLDPEQINLNCVRIDASVHAPKIIELFSNMTNIEEMLEAEGSSNAATEDLKILSYIVGKNYSSCETFEIDLAEQGIIPYFRVVCDGVKYGSENMGLGEIATHYIMWNLKRIVKNSILLLEEPETYLAPRSQEALLNVIAKISDKNKIWVVLTTHSPSILKKIPPKHVRLLTRGATNIEVIEPNVHSDYLQTLGISTQKNGIIFVEDRAARVFTKYWIGSYTPHLIQEYEIIDIAGVENILHQLKEFPNNIKWFKIFGLFDGDQKPMISEEYKWSYSFLPGTEPLEIQFMRLASQKRNEFATIIRRELAQVNIALSSLEGKDHHDWLIELPELLGLSYEQLIGDLYNLAMSDEHYKSLADDAFKELIEKLIY